MRCPNLSLLPPAPHQPTRVDRGWFVFPFGKNPWWVYLASALPALLVTILIFMDQQITAVIVNRKEHKLRVSRDSSHAPGWGGGAQHRPGYRLRPCERPLLGCGLGAAARQGLAFLFASCTFEVTEPPGC